MRVMMLGWLGLVAACSGGGEAGNQAEAPVAAVMGAGQWEVDLETTAFRSTDGKTPVIAAAVGDKAKSVACLAAGEEAKPAPAVLIGDGYDCKYTSSYIKEGRVNAQLSCTREGKGPISISVSGSSTADTLEGTVDSTSFLSGDGDYAMSQKLTARRTAPACQAPAAQPA